MFAEGNYSHDILANTPLDNWRSAPQETKAGGMTGMGIHLLDGFQFLIGPMARVSALSTKRILPFESRRHHAGDACLPQRRDRARSRPR